MAILALDDVVTTTVAPRAFASCTAKSETPPVPSVTTTSPAATQPTSSELHAVVAAQGNVAACASESLTGDATTALAGTKAYC